MVQNTKSHKDSSVAQEEGRKAPAHHHHLWPWQKQSPREGNIFQICLWQCLFDLKILVRKLCNCAVKWTQTVYLIQERKLHSHESLTLSAFSLSFVNCCSDSSQRGWVIANTKYPTVYTEVSFPVSRNWKQHSSAFFANCICEKQSEKCIQDTNLWFCFFYFRVLRFGANPKFGFCPLKIPCEDLVGLVVGLFLCFLHGKLYSWSHVT